MKRKKILIVRLSAIGDVVNTLPAATVLRETYPDAYIAWVVEDKAKDIIEGNPLLDDVFVLQRSRWQHLLKNPITFIKGLKEIKHSIENIRRRKFDVVFDFHGNLRSGLITSSSGGRLRVGFDRFASKEGNFLFTNRKVHIANHKIKRTGKFLSLLKSFSLDTPRRETDIYVPEETKANVDRFLNNIEGGGACCCDPSRSQQVRRIQKVGGEKICRSFGYAY